VTYRQALECLYLYGSFVTVAFLAIYTPPAWRSRTSMSLHLWTFGFINAQIFGLGLWSLYLGRAKLPAEKAITLGLLCEFVIVATWRLLLLIREQARTRKMGRDRAG
jgi:hypothetical protein